MSRRRLAWLSAGAVLLLIAGALVLSRTDRGTERVARTAASDAPAPPPGRASTLPPPGPEPLATRKLVVGEASTFGQISDLSIVGGVAIVIDLAPVSGNRPLGRISLDSGQIQWAGRVGDGPGELRQPNAVTSAADGTGDVWVYDAALRRHYRYRTDPWTGMPIRELRSASALLFEPHLGNEEVVTNGFFAGELLRFYAVEDGGLRFERGAGRSLFPDALPIVAQFLNRSSLAVRGDGDRMVLAFLYLSRLQIYTREGTLVRAVAGPRQYALRYRIVHDREGNPKFDHEPDSRWLYLDVTATQESIYALFSGRRDGDHPDDMYLGEEIHVFAWDGTLRKIWHLPDAVSQISIDPSTGLLYGAREEPFPSIVAYSLDGDGA